MTKLSLLANMFKYNFVTNTETYDMNHNTPDVVARLVAGKTDYKSTTYKPCWEFNEASRILTQNTHLLSQNQWDRR